MAHHPTTYSTRSLSLLMFAAFAGAAIWLFAPHSFGGSGGGDASASLPSSLKVDGTVQVQTQGDVVTHLVVPLALRGTEGIRLDASARLTAVTAMSDTASAAVPTMHSVSWLDGNGDDVLDAGEHALLTVDLPATSSVHPGNPLELVLRTSDGSTLTIEDVLTQ